MNSAIAAQNLATAQKTYELVRAQYRAGAVSGLDLTQAEQSVQSQKSALSQTAVLQVQARTALVALLDQPVTAD